MEVNVTHLDALFRPESIAIIGASTNPKRIGGRPLNYLRQYGYQGRIYPVNRKYSEIDNLPCYPDVKAIRESVDLAIVALPGNQVLECVKQCASKGVKAVVVFSSGFGEVDEFGKQQQEEMAGIARAHNMRLLGPNCLGLFNTNNGLVATFSTILEIQPPLQSNISFVSQSGAFGSYVFTMARQRGIGFGQFVATGNESDVDVADCIDYFVDDPSTDVIACYLEGAKDGEKLLAAFRKASERGKPVIALKVGRTDAGKQAALSHTGSLAGSDQVFEEVFRQFGVWRAETVEEFIDVLYGCSRLPQMKGNRVAVFTVSGGVGIMLADSLAPNGLVMPQPQEEVKRSLKELLPYAGVNNPIDTTAQLNARPELLGQFMETVLASGEYDAAVVFLGFTGLYPDTLEARLPPLEKCASKYSTIPIITVTLSDAQSRHKFGNKDIFLVDSPTQAVNVLKALNFFRCKPAVMTPVLDTGGIAAPGLPEGRKVLTEYESKSWLAQYGISVTKEFLASSEEEAVALAKEIGFPIVLKGMSPQILHKTDLGLVQLNLSSEETVREKFRYMKDQVAKAEGAQFDGVLVQEMLREDAVELFIGSKRDPLFGQMVVVGVGGIFIEVFHDAVMRKAPVTVLEAEAMLAALRGRKLLSGARGKEKRDTEALCRTISRFSELIAACGDAVEEIDLNPIMVFGQGKGVKVADALITLTGNPSMQEVL